MDALTIALADDPDILVSGLNNIEKVNNLTLINKNESLMFKNWQSDFLNYI